MLVLKRHYQFWFAILGLHKIGADRHPGDEPAGRARLLLPLRAPPASAPSSAPQTATRRIRWSWPNGITANATHQDHGWRQRGTAGTISTRNPACSPATIDAHGRTAPCGDDPMLMFFTSGTSGYPKIAAHNYKYPLGHYITAKYWHRVNPDGLHLTISDTGWAKCTLGQALRPVAVRGARCSSMTLTRFDAAKILPHVCKLSHHHLLRAADHVPHADQAGSVAVRSVLHPSMPPSPARR